MPKISLLKQGVRSGTRASALLLAPFFPGSRPTQGKFFFLLFFSFFLTHVARGKWKKTKRKQNNKQKKEKMSIKPNNLLFLCYLWWSICLIKFTKHQSCSLHLLPCYEAFKWSFSHSCIFQITQDICPQTSKKIVFCYLWASISPAVFI